MGTSGLNNAGVGFGLIATSLSGAGLMIERLAIGLLA
jgi:hypothetical protein